MSEDKQLNIELVQWFNDHKRDKLRHCPFCHVPMMKSFNDINMANPAFPMNLPLESPKITSSYSLACPCCVFGDLPTEQDNLKKYPIYAGNEEVWLDGKKVPLYQRETERIPS